MLSNIANVEIPELEESLVDWLARQPRARLEKLDIEPCEIADRTFYPRLALGKFFYDQLQAMITRAEENDIDVTVRTRCTVQDAIGGDHGMTLVVMPHRGAIFGKRFDHVVLATGHQWPAEPEASRAIS
jgi:uncharacterized NAD(P)/FAD-binding protein YdhS